MAIIHTKIGANNNISAHHCKFMLQPVFNTMNDLLMVV